MDIRNRIVEYGTKPADEFKSHPQNWRTHPESQSEAVRASLSELGWIGVVVENARTGHLVDGHERVWQALENGNTEVPYIMVDLSEEEERLALVTFDPITMMAGADREKLEELLYEVSTGEAALQELINQTAEDAGLFLPTSEDWNGAIGSLPSGDKSPFRQMTITLHDSQVDIVESAFRLAKEKSDFSQYPENENSNGNALTFICESFHG